MPVIVFITKPTDVLVDAIEAAVQAKDADFDRIQTMSDALMSK